MFRIFPEAIKNTENYERKVREIKRKQTTMDEDQKSAFNLAINGHNLLITGQGGTGKSFLVEIIIKYLRTKVNKKVAIVKGQSFLRRGQVKVLFKTGALL